jgi:hypothetical protein
MQKWVKRGDEANCKMLGNREFTVYIISDTEFINLKDEYIIIISTFCNVTE